MLVFMKRHSKKIIIGLGIMIIPGFVFFGVSLDIDPSGPGKIAGHLGSRKVHTGDFIKEYQALRRQILILSGFRQETPRGDFDFEQMTWDRILLLDSAKKNGIKVSDEEILDWISRQQIFFNENKRFDLNYYHLFIEKSLRITPRKFEEEIRSLLTIQKVLETMQEGHDATEQDARELYALRFAPRDLDYVILPGELTETLEAVSDLDLKTFYESVRSSFYEPEKAKVRFVILDKDSDLNTTVVKERLFQEGLGGATSLEGLELKEADLTRSDSIPGIGFSEDITEAVFRLNPLEVRTGWLTTDKGDALFELVTKVERKQVSFDQAKAPLKEQIEMQQKRIRLLAQASETHEEMLKAGFDTVAGDKGWPLHHETGYTAGAYLDKVGVVPDFDGRMEDLKAGDIAAPIETKAGFVIIRTLSVQSDFTDGFDEKKDALMSELKYKREFESYNGKMADLRTRLKINPKAMAALFPGQDRP